MAKVYIALLQKVMVGRSIIDRKSYQKIKLPRISLSNIDEKEFGIKLWFSFEPKYLTGPLNDGDLLSMKLIHNSERPELKSGLSRFADPFDAQRVHPDGVIYETNKKGYDEFSRDLATYIDLLKGPTSGVDYNLLEKEFYNLIDSVGKKKSIRDINKQLTKTQKVLQEPINENNVAVREAAKVITSHFESDESTFKPNTVLLF